MENNEQYQLVLWPYCQNFIGEKDCYFLSESTRGDIIEDAGVSQGVFVPIDKLNSLDEETLSKIADGYESIYEKYDWPDFQNLDGYVGNRYICDEEEEDIAVFVDPNKK